MQITPLFPKTRAAGPAEDPVGVSRYVNTWTWLEGRWQVISAQVTPLPP
jgi:hypothetical protein